MTTDPRWLDEDEQRVWRSWLLANRRVTAALNRGLHTSSGLSGPDYEVLVNLTDNAEGRLRMRDLAIGMDWERSRLSHQIRRMESRGLVERTDCEDDARGHFVLITQAGRTAIRQAAPDHVELVRQFVIDPLSTTELHQLGQLMGKVIDAVDGAGDQEA